MKNNILQLIKSSATNQNDYKALENIYQLYEQLQYSFTIKQMAEDIFAWLARLFKISNMTFSLFDMEKNTKEIIFEKGESFYLDDNLSFFFIINTHTKLNAIVSFCALSNIQYKILDDNKPTIDSAFFQISPIIQSGIIKKNFIESSSLDSVTNVYNRKYLIKNINKYINLSGKEYKNIFFLMLGIDRFKAIIDEFDYNIGDKVLIELAKIIHTNITEVDMVARLIGDEFLISIISNDNKASVINIGKNIIQGFSKIQIQVDDQNNTLQKTICIGIDTYSNNNNLNIDKIIKNADIALNEAKNLGRGKLVHYDELNNEDNVELF